jgi:hypothetical protein
MKQLGDAILGLVLTIIGAALFLMNVHVSSFSFFYVYHGVSIGGILMILLIVSFITLIVKNNWVTRSIFIGLCILFFVSVIASIHFYISYISAFKLVLILGTLALGIGLLLKSLVFTKDPTLKEEKKKDAN